MTVWSSALMRVLSSETMSGSVADSCCCSRFSSRSMSSLQLTGTSCFLMEIIYIYGMGWGQHMYCPGGPLGQCESLKYYRNKWSCCWLVYYKRILVSLVFRQVEPLLFSHCCCFFCYIGNWTVTYITLYITSREVAESRTAQSATGCSNFLNFLKLVWSSPLMKMFVVL